MAGAAGITYYSYNKYVATTKSLNSIDVNIDNIHDVSINLQHIKAKIDLKISNPSVYNLGVSTFDLISITEIQFFNKKNGFTLWLGSGGWGQDRVPFQRIIFLFCPLGFFCTP